MFSVRFMLKLNGLYFSEPFWNVGNSYIFEEILLFFQKPYILQVNIVRQIMLISCIVSTHIIPSNEKKRDDNFIVYNNNLLYINIYGCVHLLTSNANIILLEYYQIM